MKEACGEERNRRHCREGACVSWKALSNALDGAIDRDILSGVGEEELQVKNNSQNSMVTNKGSRHSREEMHQSMPLEAGRKSKAHHPSCRELGPIRDFSKSCWVESSVEPTAANQLSLPPCSMKP